MLPKLAGTTAKTSKSACHGSLSAQHPQQNVKLHQVGPNSLEIPSVTLPNFYIHLLNRVEHSHSSWPANHQEVDEEHRRYNQKDMRQSCLSYATGYNHFIDLAHAQILRTSTLRSTVHQRPRSQQAIYPCRTCSNDAQQSYRLSQQKKRDGMEHEWNFSTLGPCVESKMTLKCRVLPILVLNDD